MHSYLLFTIFAVASSAAWETVPPRFQVYFDPEFELVAMEPMEKHSRQTRQLHGSTFINSDKTSGFNAKLPFAGNDKNQLSVIGGANFDAERHLQSATGGVAWDHAKGHGLSLTQTHVPNFGEKLTASGHANLFHNPNHDVTANGFITRNQPSIPHVPNFNTMGGGLDYMYKNKVGASLGVAHTPLFHQTDYSATGNLNIFRDRTSSLDFNAGFSKSVSPFMKSSGWEPSTGFTFRKFF